MPVRNIENKTLNSRWQVLISGILLVGWILFLSWVAWTSKDKTTSRFVNSPIRSVAVSS